VTCDNNIRQKGNGSTFDFFPYHVKTKKNLKKLQANELGKADFLVGAGRWVGFFLFFSWLCKVG
jgi:hypothetical protein